PDSNKKANPYQLAGTEKSFSVHQLNENNGLNVISSPRTMRPIRNQRRKLSGRILRRKNCPRNIPASAGTMARTAINRRSPD
ncbi:hypothetical protein, partial [Staphylococcus aureus]|uniref:hypothetical protein n=1 Tax=Staphylococcus aureus TaxID=1280 RepID=UPI001C53362C